MYSSLVWKQPATGHVVVAQGEGGLAVLRLFQQMNPREPIRVLFADSASAKKQYADIISKLVPEGLHIGESGQELFSMLDEQLPECLMGTQFYVVGDEGFIWSTLAVLRQYGVQDKNVEKELAGTLARPVYCVHCKTTNQDVHHNIHRCVGCGLNLFVRDHFSRRLGAYMGVMADAEEPGNVPAVEEIYP